MSHPWNKEMIRVDATLGFKFKCNFEGHKVNWGHNVSFYFLNDLDSM